MSKRNSPQAKAQRRAERRVRKAENNAPATSKQMWVKTKDKYGNEKLVPVMMPTRRQGLLDRRARS